DTDLREAVHVGLAGPEVPALHRVVEEPPDGIAVVLIVLGRVDTALSRDGVGTTRAVLKAEALNFVAQLAEGGRGRPACEPGTNPYEGVPPFVGGVHQLHLEFPPIPFFSERTGGNAGVQFHLESSIDPRPLTIDHRFHLNQPNHTASGITDIPSHR